MRSYEEFIDAVEKDIEDAGVNGIPRDQIPQLRGMQLNAIDALKRSKIGIPIDMQSGHRA
jgi:hypothetical protein